MLVAFFIMWQVFLRRPSTKIDHFDWFLSAYGAEPCRLTEILGFESLRNLFIIFLKKIFVFKTD